MCHWCVVRGKMCPTAWACPELAVQQRARSYQSDVTHRFWVLRKCSEAGKEHNHGTIFPLPWLSAFLRRFFNAQRACTRPSRPAHLPILPDFPLPARPRTRIIWVRRQWQREYCWLCATDAQESRPERGSAPVCASKERWADICWRQVYAMKGPSPQREACSPCCWPIPWFSLGGWGPGPGKTPAGPGGPLPLLNPGNLFGPSQGEFPLRPGSVFPPVCPFFLGVEPGPFCQFPRFLSMVNWPPRVVSGRGPTLGWNIPPV